jgi:hypothetical protein
MIWTSPPIIALQIRRTGVEHDHQNIQPLVFEKAPILGHIDRQKCDVDRRHADNDPCVDRSIGNTQNQQ